MPPFRNLEGWDPMLSSRSHDQDWYGDVRNTKNPNIWRAEHPFTNYSIFIFMLMLRVHRFDLSCLWIICILSIFHAVSDNGYLVFPSFFCSAQSWCIMVFYRMVFYGFYYEWAKMAPQNHCYPTGSGFGVASPDAIEGAHWRCRYSRTGGPLGSGAEIGGIDVSNRID